MPYENLSTVGHEYHVLVHQETAFIDGKLVIQIHFSHNTALMLSLVYHFNNLWIIPVRLIPQEGHHPWII